MSMFVQSEFRAFLNKSRQFTTQKLPFFSSFRLYFYIGKNTNRSISKKDNIKIFVSQWILYQILVTLKVEPVLYSAQFFGTVHASRTVCLGDFDSDPKLEGWRREFANFETSSRFCMKNHNIEAIWGACLI